jgi:multimeric flavodoxin WrbA
MKIVGIVCSPRKGGNTEILVGEALDAARSDGVETELIRLADMNIAPCDGCGSCAKTGVCRIDDDMQSLYRSFDEADGIIFGTPSYFGNVSAQAKAVIDRTYVSLLHGKLRGKVAAALVATRRIGGGQILSILYSYFTVQGMMIAGGGIGYGRKKGDVREGPGGSPVFTAIEEAQAVGRRVVKTIQKVS